MCIRDRNIEDDDDDDGGWPPPKTASLVPCAAMDAPNLFDGAESDLSPGSSSIHIDVSMSKQVSADEHSPLRLHPPKRYSWFLELSRVALDPAAASTPGIGGRRLVWQVNCGASTPLEFEKSSSVISSMYRLSLIHISEPTRPY